MIDIQHIKKSFGKNDVLRDVTLTVEDGTIYGLIGKNGAGKTTLISILAGLSDADGGSCSIDGKIISKSSSDNSVGYLPDIPAFFDFLTAGEYLDFLLNCNGKDKKRKKYLLDLVKISPKTTIKTMSRGMKQRLGIASTLINDPKAILLDEPTSALDPMGRYELIEILSELKSQRKSILLSTHILTDMESVCDKVGFLTGGIIAKSLSPKKDAAAASIKICFASDINLKHFERQSAFNVSLQDSKTALIEFKNGNILPQKELFSLLSQIDNQIISIDTERCSLDSIFREVCL